MGLYYAQHSEYLGGVSQPYFSGIPCLQIPHNSSLPLSFKSARTSLLTDGRLLFTQQLINVATTSFPIQASRFEIHTPTTSFLPLSFPLLTGVDSHVLQRGAGLVGRLVWCCIGARLGLSGLFRPAHHSLYCSQNFRSRGQQTGNWLLVLVLAEADDEARDFRDAVYIRTKGETLCIDGANGWPAQGGLDFSEAGEAVVEVVGMAWQRRHTST